MARPDTIDWHDAADAEPPFACVFVTNHEGEEDERIADFYGPKAAERAEAYAGALTSGVLAP